MPSTRSKAGKEQEDKPQRTTEAIPDEADSTAIRWPYTPVAAKRVRRVLDQEDEVAESLAVDWQNGLPQGPLLRIFEILCADKDDNAAMHNAAAACMLWREACLEVTLGDTAASRPERPPLTRGDAQECKRPATQATTCAAVDEASKSETGGAEAVTGPRRDTADGDAAAADLAKPAKAGTAGTHANHRVRRRGHRHRSQAHCPAPANAAMAEAAAAAAAANAVHWEAAADAAAGMLAAQAEAGAMQQQDEQQPQEQRQQQQHARPHRDCNRPPWQGLGLLLMAADQPQGACSQGRAANGQGLDDLGQHRHAQPAGEQLLGAAGAAAAADDAATIPSLQQQGQHRTHAPSRHRKRRYGQQDKQQQHHKQQQQQQQVAQHQSEVVQPMAAHGRWIRMHRGSAAAAPTGAQPAVAAAAAAGGNHVQQADFTDNEGDPSEVMQPTTAQVGGRKAAAAAASCARARRSNRGRAPTGLHYRHSNEIATTAAAAAAAGHLGAAEITDGVPGRQQPQQQQQEQQQQAGTGRRHPRRSQQQQQQQREPPAEAKQQQLQAAQVAQPADSTEAVAVGAPVGTGAAGSQARTGSASTRQQDSWLGSLLHHIPWWRRHAAS